MAVRIKLKRFGRRHQPHYRLTAVDRRRSGNSRVLEELGLYSPITRQEDKQVVLKRERIEYWLSVGAQPTETVRRILEKQGLAREEKAAKPPRRNAGKTVAAKPGASKAGTPKAR
jgi:small subunit ribosomal protein S16